MSPYPRDLIGYGEHPPHPRWPGGARIAVQFVLNYEEGAERAVLHGDEVSEYFLSEMVGTGPVPGMRHMSMESLYEYGARAGFWRLYNGFVGRKIPVTVYGVATALMRAPQQLLAMQEAGWEIASHGYKWIQHKDMPAEEERDQIKAEVRKKIAEGVESARAGRLHDGEEVFAQMETELDEQILAEDRAGEAEAAAHR